MPPPTLFPKSEAEALVLLNDVPEAETGAPQPTLFADEQQVVLAYIIADEGRGIRSAVISFELCDSHLFGSPNDEAMHGHRLAPLGLENYSAHEVLNSAWIADLCARNRVHSNHKDAMYVGLRHFILTFHDSTFEAVARGYSVTLEPGSPSDAILRNLRPPAGRSRV